MSEDLSETNKDKRDHRTITMYRKIDESFQPSDEQLEYYVEPNEHFYHSGLYLVKKENGEFTLCYSTESNSGYNIPYFFCWQVTPDDRSLPIYLDKDGRRLDPRGLFDVLGHKRRPH